MTITNECFPLPLRRRKLMDGFTSQNIRVIRCHYTKFPIPPKVKEVHFKHINSIYPCKEYLHSKFNIEDNECAFCTSNIETEEHLFFACIFTKIFWDSFCIWADYNGLGISSLTYSNVKFGLMLENKKKQFTINNLIVMAKFFIHKCKFGDAKPAFIVFLKDLVILKDSLKLCNSKKAMWLYNDMSALSFNPVAP